MNPYMHVSVGNINALDFTPQVKNEPEEPIEPPVLDLSCKKPCPRESSIEYSPTNSLESEVHQTNLLNTEGKSPFESRTFMVTPPSETDSPKKAKFEPIYNSTIPPVIGGVPTHPPSMPMNLQIPLVPTILPPPLGQNGTEVKPIEVVGSPVTSTTAASTVYPGDIPLPSSSPETGKKAPRPFKAYPKDPLSLTIGTAELIYDATSNEAYSEFRKRMLESVRKSNEGTNVKMRRSTKSPGLPTSTMDEKDAAYWERRRKNNEAAKRSRDARRAKEDEIAIRAAFLEQENMKLKYELVALRNETAKLRCMVYST